MKVLICIPLLAILSHGYSQNPSYNIIYDSIQPQIDAGNYEKAKEIWLHTEKSYKMDPQEEYLFVCSALEFGDVSFFRKRMKKLIKNSGFNFTASDTLPENLTGYNELFYSKQLISWLINISAKQHPKWRDKHPSACKIREEINDLVLKDQYARSYFRPSDFSDSICDFSDQYWAVLQRTDYRNMADLATICIRNNGMPNHFDHGTETYYKLSLIIWHNLKNPVNRENAWSIILPWVEKAYFEGKIGKDLFQSYDRWLFEHTGYQYYGFQGNAPVKDSEGFEERKKKYKFLF